MEGTARVDRYVEKAELWPAEVRALRAVLLGCGLDETLKWGKPCYSRGEANLAIVQEMKGFLALMLFKGALLEDPDAVLEDQGQNTRAAKRVTFRSVEDVERLTPAVQALVREAIRVEQEGLELPPAPELELVAELQAALDSDAELEAAFEGLTPGRQREYHLHVSSAKQAATRERRVAQCAPRILANKGLRD